jgi:membrane-associated phospholipid phosphatase
VSPRRAFEFAAAAAYAALAGLVAAGTCTGIDRWAIGHAMPWGTFGGGKPTLVEGLVPLLHASFGSPSAVFADVVTVPGSFLVSLAIVVACRRFAFVAAWVAANVLEEIGKTALTRPPLCRHRLHLVGYDNSFPSGHTLRTLVVAAAVAAALPRARHAAWAWAALSVVTIELAGYHVPTDVAGGLLLGGLLLSLATRPWSSWRSIRSSTTPRPSSRAR